MAVNERGGFDGSAPRAPTAADISQRLALGALVGVDVHGLSGWVASAVTPAIIALMHGERVLLTILVQPQSDRATSGAAADRIDFTFSLDAIADASRQSGDGDAKATFCALVNGAELRNATAPLTATDLLLAGALGRAGAPAGRSSEITRFGGALATADRLASGFRRNGVRRMAAFAAAMVAREGFVATVKFARLPREQRQRWLSDRRRAQHTAAGLTVAAACPELQDEPPPVQPFETAIFAPWPGAAGSTVPLIGYQQYALARLRYPKALNTDAERREALIWYIETYSTFRRPFQVPFSADQLAWLLESEVEGAPPRIVDWFVDRRRQDGALSTTAASTASLAYWWCLQMAVSLNVEQTLIPLSYIDLLRAPIGAPSDLVPSCEFLRQHFTLQAHTIVDLGSSEGRLTAYVESLLEVEGLHHAQFMPDGVLEQIASLAPLLVSEAEGHSGFGLRARALEAIALRESSLRIRRSHADLSPARLGQDWLSATSELGGPAYEQAGRTSPPGGSAVPFPVRVIGPLNSRSGLGQAARLSVASLQAVGVEVETVDFLPDNPAPRGRYFANDFDLSPGFGVNLLHLSGESLPLAAAFMSPEFFIGKVNVGYFFWELPHPADCHLLALKQIDELWVASSYNRDVYAPYLPGRVFRVGMALEPLDERSQSRATTRQRFGLPDSAFVFVTTFDSFSSILRKNPAGVIRAFKRAFPLGSEDVRLVVKTHNLMRGLGEARADVLRTEIKALCASDARIVLINATLQHKDLLTLKSACDAYVSLHRSEGWGFGMVESMQLGLPVIATAFSGNLDFCTEATSWLVDYRQVGLQEDDYVFVKPNDYWADPDLDSAAKCMCRAVSDPESASSKGEAARRYVEAHLSPAAVGAVYLERLRDLVAGRSGGLTAPHPTLETHPRQAR